MSRGGAGEGDQKNEVRTPGLMKASVSNAQRPERSLSISAYANVFLVRRSQIQRHESRREAFRQRTGVSRR